MDGSKRQVSSIINKWCMHGWGLVFHGCSKTFQKHIMFLVLHSIVPQNIAKLSGKQLIMHVIIEHAQVQNLRHTFVGECSLKLLRQGVRSQATFIVHSPLPYICQLCHELLLDSSGKKLKINEIKWKLCTSSHLMKWKPMTMPML